MTRCSFLLGAVVAPLLRLGRMQRIKAVPPALAGMVEAEVLSGAALVRRIEWALLALWSGA
jgi:hypothetical protein